MHAVTWRQRIGRACFQSTLDQCRHGLAQAAAGVTRVARCDAVQIVRKVDGRSHHSIMVQMHIDVNGVDADTIPAENARRSAPSRIGDLAGARTTSRTFFDSPATGACTMNTCNVLTNLKSTRSWRASACRCEKFMVWDLQRVGTEQ